jgi:hypothetical protein
VGGPEFAALLLPDVQELLTNGAVRPIVRKKAALALLRLLRKSTSDIEELLQHDVRCRAAASPKTPSDFRQRKKQHLKAPARLLLLSALMLRCEAIRSSSQ